MRPFSTAAGTIGVDDEIQVDFELVLVPAPGAAGKLVRLGRGERRALGRVRRCILGLAGAGTPPRPRPRGSRMTMRATRAILLLLASGGPAASAADPPPPEIAWDQDLAFEHDRENYQRTLSGIVDGAWRLAQAETGLALRRPVKVRVHSRAGYEQAFGTGAAWTRGAHYSRGEIHVNGGNHLGDRFAGGIAHEMVHAVLDHQGTAWRLPTWLNEGLAERVGWKRMGQEGLAPNEVEELKYAGRRSVLTPLPSQGHLTPAGYMRCRAAVLFVEGKAGKEKLLAVVRRTLEGEPFEKALDRETRWSMADLDREFADWVEHLR